MSPEGKYGTEIGVGGYEYAIFCDGFLENHHIIFRLQTRFSYVHSIEARIA